MTQIWRVTFRDNHSSSYAWDKIDVVATCAPTAIRKAQRIRSKEPYHSDKNVLGVELLAEA